MPTAKRPTPKPRKLTIARPTLKRGETYIGAIFKANGTGHHILLLPGELEKANHTQATAWAEKKGGTLPDRVEQALLFRDHKKKFQPAAYWSAEPHADYDAYAWYQAFSHGGQYYWRKDDELRARAVRRAVIR